MQVQSIIFCHNSTWRFFLFSNYLEGEGSCTGGDKFESTSCPTTTLCPKFMCKSNADCKNGATCNALTGRCVCKGGFIGLDCSLPQGNFFSGKSEERAGKVNAGYKMNANQ